MMKRFMMKRFLLSRSFMRLCLAGVFFTFFLTIIPVAFGSSAVSGALVPVPMDLPAPRWFLKILLLATFGLHLILVNIVLGSVILATVDAWRTPLSVPYPIARKVSFIPTALALTVNFGVAPFLFLQVTYGSFLYSSSVLMAIWWLCVPLFVMFSYYALYIAKAGMPFGSLGRRSFLTILTLLLLTVAFLLTTNSTLMLRPDYWFEWYASPGGNLLNLSDPTFIPRYLHMVVASVAIGGLFLAIRGWWHLRSGNHNAGEAKAIARGLSCFFHASLVQAIIGLWFLFSLPFEVRNLFLGGDLTSTFFLLLVVALFIVALMVAHHKKVMPATLVTVVLVFIMVYVRDLVRDAMLAPFTQNVIDSTPGSLPYSNSLPLPVANGQYGGLAVFLISTILGTVCIIWMTRIAIRVFSNNALPSENILTPASEKGE